MCVYIYIYAARGDEFGVVASKVQSGVSGHSPRKL